MNEIGYHTDFKLNGESFFSSVDLLEYTKNEFPEAHSFLISWFNDLSYVIVDTSGSTGTPKPIKIDKQHMLNSAIATGMYFNLGPKTTALLCLSTKYIAGKMMLVRALILGWHLDIVKATSNPLIGIYKKYDFSAMVPFQLEQSLNKLYLLNKLIVGGGAIPKSMLNNIENIKTKIYATYGMTETVTHIALKQVSPKDNIHKFYQVLDNVKISIDNRGCLVIDAPYISTKQIVTNDLVKIISNTEFNWLGRFDNVINSGGIKLIPEQIESKLYHIILNRFFITSLPDDRLGEKVIMVVEGEKDINLKSQISNLKSIETYEIPKEIYWIPNFAETASKKVDRSKTIEKIININLYE